MGEERRVKTWRRGRGRQEQRHEAREGGQSRTEREARGGGCMGLEREREGENEGGERAREVSSPF